MSGQQGPPRESPRIIMKTQQHIDEQLEDDAEYNRQRCITVDTSGLKWVGSNQQRGQSSSASRGGRGRGRGGGSRGRVNANRGSLRSEGQGGGNNSTPQGSQSSGSNRNGIQPGSSAGSHSTSNAGSRQASDDGSQQGRSPPAYRGSRPTSQAPGDQPPSSMYHQQGRGQPRRSSASSSDLEEPAGRPGGWHGRHTPVQRGGPRPGARSEPRQRGDSQENPWLMNADPDSEIEVTSSFRVLRSRRIELQLDPIPFNIPGRGQSSRSRGQSSRSRGQSSRSRGQSSREGNTGSAA